VSGIATGRGAHQATAHPKRRSVCELAIYRRMTNEKTRKGLVLNVGFALALVFCTNLLIFLINPSEMASPRDNYRFEPPGWAIGLVWTFLLGLARWLVAGNEERPVKSSNWVFYLLLFCAAYPLGSFAEALRRNPPDF